MVLPSFYFLKSLTRRPSAKDDDKENATIGRKTEFLDQCFATTSTAGSFEMTELPRPPPKPLLEDLDEDALLRSSHLVSSSLVIDIDKSGPVRPVRFNPVIIKNNECLVIDLDEEDDTSSISSNESTATSHAAQSMNVSLGSKLESHRRAARHDPSINGVYVSLSTVKYSVLAVVTIGLLTLFGFFVTVGFVMLNRCAVNQQLPIYLIVMGFSGLTRILLWSTCSYSFSKSMLVKVYEHLVWRLVVNRARASYYHAREVSMKHTVDTTSTAVSTSSDSSSQSSHSVSSLFKYNKCACFFGCLFSFFCCRCLCLMHQPDKPSQCDTTGKNNKTRTITGSAPGEIDSSRETNKENSTKDRPRFELGPPVKKKQRSHSNLSATATIGGANNSSSFSTQSNLAIDLNRIEVNPNGLQPKRLQRSRSVNGGMGSRQTNDVKKRGKQVAFDLSRRRADSTNYSHRYFYGKYGYNYGTHKRLQRHHNKLHRPLRLIDLKSVRYCVAYLFQRCIDVFMLIWFVCGNYWLFSSSLDDDSNNSSNTTTTSSNSTKNSSYFSLENTPNRPVRSIKIDSEKLLIFKSKVNLSSQQEKPQLKRISIRRVFVSINNYTAVNNSVYNISNQIAAISTTDGVNLLCYNIAFIQIISTYAFLALIVILIIVYQVHLIVYVKRRPVVRRKFNVALTGQVTRSSPEQLAKDGKRARVTRSSSLPARPTAKSSLRK